MRLLLQTVGLLLLLLLLLGVLLQFPSVQTSLVNRVAGKITAETGVEVSIDRVMLRLPMALSVKGLYVQDLSGDTLLYAEEIRVRLRPVALRKNHLDVRFVYLKGVVANIYRLPDGDRFNFELLLGAAEDKPQLPGEELLPEMNAGQEVLTDLQHEGKRWIFSLRELVINRISVSYEDHLSGMDLRFALQRLVFEPGEIAPEQLRFHAKKLLLDGPELALTLSEGSGEKPDAEPFAFDMPDIDVLLDDLQLKDLRFLSDDRVSGIETRLEASLSISGLVARDDTLGFGFHASQGRLNDSLEISEISFLLAAGQSITLEALQLRTAGSSLNARLVSPVSLFEPGLPGLDDPRFDLLLHEMVVGDDIAGFVLERHLVEQFFSDRRKLRVMAGASGSLSDVRLDHFKVSYGELAELQVEGLIAGLPDLARTSFFLPDVKLQLAGSIWSDDAFKSIAGEALPLTGPVTVEASLHGRLDDFQAQAMASGNFGQMELEGSYLQDPGGLAVYDLRLDVKDLLAGELAGISLLEGGLTASLHLAGRGIDPKTAELSYDLLVEELTANQYVYRGVMINGGVSAGRATLAGSYHDEALSFDLTGMADLVSEHLHVKVLADLSHLDAQTLHVTKDPIILKTRLDADVVFTANDFFDGSLSLSETILQMNDHSYTLDSIALVTRSSISDSLQTYMFEIKSRILEASYSGNVSPAGIPAFVTGHFASHTLTDRRKAEMRLDLGSFELDGLIFNDLRIDSQLEDSLMMLQLFTGGQFDEPWMLARGDPSQAEVLFSGSDLAALFSAEGVDRFSGVLDGRIIIGGLLEEDFSIQADLGIAHLGFNNDTIGDLTIIMKQPEPMRFAFDAALRNYGNRLDIKGSYLMAEEPHLDVNLGIDRFDLSGVEGFTGGELQQLEGLLSGRVRINGPLANLDYTGELNLHGVKFLATFVNVVFSMPDESIIFDRDQLSFRDFSVYDPQGRRATLSGRVVTTDWMNPVFNLSLVSRNLLALEVPPGQNDQFSGRAIISSDLRLRGELQNLVLDGSLGLNEGTNFQIMVPQSGPEAIGDEGVVLFVGPDSIARGTDAATTDPLTTSLRNLNISINVEVDPATDVRIVIDEQAGDFLEVKGGGMISYGTDPGGRIRLSGRYELVDGTYLLTFYDVLSRQFGIVRGSRFVWTGDPMNPDVELTAIYQVRANARELFESSSAAATGQGMPGMQQQFPFEVMLKMRGPMMSPEISFGIQLPPEHRQALEGRLQSRLDELARNESALNKQVFALLLFGHFIADNPLASALEGPGFTATARTSASRILTQQLNRLSDQYIRGVDIQFDIESFQDETDAGLQGRTQLNLEVSKNFFDERVRVTVGGNIELEDDRSRQTSAGDIAGDFLIEYFLNEQGNLVLKGFRKKEFGDLFEGQVIETGVALLFSKTYNRFRELFGKNEE